MNGDNTKVYASWPSYLLNEIIFPFPTTIRASPAASRIPVGSAAQPYRRNYAAQCKSFDYPTQSTNSVNLVQFTIKINTLVLFPLPSRYANILASYRSRLGTNGFYSRTVRERHNLINHDVMNGMLEWPGAGKLDLLN